MNKCSTFVVTLPEHFSGKSVLAIKREVQSSLKAEDPCLVMDLSCVREIDCAGLDLLLECMLEISRRNGSVSLAGISPEAATFLELVRMDRAFGMFPTVEEAVAAGSYRPAQSVVVPGVPQVAQPAAA